jgi:hypothetical protein
MNDPRTMNFSELKVWLRDRLHLRGTAAADINLQREEAPYERPVALWKSGSDDFRNDFRRAVLDLVAEAATQPWQPKPFNELSLLLETADLWEAVRPLESAARSPRLLQHDGGDQLHMLVLRTLLALGWTGTPEFWLAQKDLVGTRWPGIIFEGLARQDVDLAFSRLPDLASGQEGMRLVLQLFPGLMRDLSLGMSTLRTHASTIVDKLQPEAADTLREWFRLRDYPLIPTASGAKSRLLVALGSFLGPDSAPRFRSPMLCGSPNGDCVLA